jgi:hypothetical protein
MKEQEQFLLKLKDPDLYNVNMAANAILNEYDYVKSLNISEFGPDDMIFSVGGLPREYRMWKLRLDIDCVDILPLNGLEASLEFTLRQHVFNASNVKVSDYLHEGQHIQVVFRTK